MSKKKKSVELSSYAYERWEDVFEIPDHLKQVFYENVGGDYVKHADTAANIALGGAVRYVCGKEILPLKTIQANFASLQDKIIEWGVSATARNYSGKYFKITDNAVLHRRNILTTSVDSFESDTIPDDLDTSDPKNRISVIDDFAIYATDSKSLEEAIELVGKYSLKYLPVPESNSYDIGLLMKSETAGLKVSKYRIKNRYEVDLKKHYNDDFPEFNDVVQKSIMEDNGGLLILHGDPGTGKTSYIKYLASKLRSKTFIFIPPSFAQALSDPNFISVMLNHPGSILVIEDAENCLKSREHNSGNATAVSNILNMTDGILGDVIKCHVIATVNTDLKHIDEALTRSGRNKGIYKFTPLSTKKTKALGGTGEMTISDIFNQKKVYDGWLEQVSTIGFGKK